jgi:hypothetical protein
MTTGGRSGGKIVAGMLLLAGVAAIAGAFLTWVDLSSAGISFADGSVSADPNGVDATYGWVAVGGGVTLALCGLICLRIRSRSLGVVAIVTATVIGGVCGFVAATPEERFIDYAVDTAATEAFPAEEVRREMETLYVQNAVQVRPGIGLHVSAAGALLGLLGGLGLALGRSRPTPSGEGVATSHDIDVHQRLATVLGTERSPARGPARAYPDVLVPRAPATTDDVSGSEVADPVLSPDEASVEPARRGGLRG